jgi:hypothetical protein
MDQQRTAAQQSTGNNDDTSINRQPAAMPTTAQQSTGINEYTTINRQESAKSDTAINRQQRRQRHCTTINRQRR